VRVTRRLPPFLPPRFKAKEIASACLTAAFLLRGLLVPIFP
jgi:hypothetical protein